MGKAQDGSRSADARPPWYTEGLRFECQTGCGACCVNHDTHTHVYLEDEDVDRLADRLELTRRQFLSRYTMRDDGHRILRMDSPRCPLLEGTRCTVYSARPRQCRTFPFWSENLERRLNWNRASRLCPGIGRGKLHSLRTIRGHLTVRDD